MFSGLFSLSGIFFGWLLSHIAPEELSKGRKHFHFLQEAIFYLILLVSIFLVVFFENYYFVIIPIFYFLFYYFFVKEQKFLIKQISNYSFFTAVFLINLDNPSILLIIFSLVFIYGLPIGLLAKKYEET